MNRETARIAWHELARYFAGGRMIRVSSGLDLIEVASAVAEDDAGRVQNWMSTGRMAPVSDLEARSWHEADAVVWAVVVKPFVLVQPGAEPH